MPLSELVRRWLHALFRRPVRTRPLPADHYYRPYWTEPRPPRAA